MKAIHIVADENIIGLREFLDAVEGLNYSLKTLAGRSITISHLKEADVLLVRSVTRVDETLLKQSAVRFVGSATTGLEHIDQDFLASEGVYFCSAFGANANAVAEYVVACIAYISQHTAENYFAKEIGIVGYGNVGKALVVKLNALGARCRVYDPLLALQVNDFEFASWEQMLGCDVLSFHVPYTQSGEFPTHRMMNSDFFNSLKSGSMLINAARGEICDEHALLAAIKEKDLKCVVDVWQNEPDISLPLLQNATLATPHIAGYSLDAKRNATQHLVEHLFKFLSIQDDSLRYRPAEEKKSELIDILESDVLSCILAAYNPENDSRALKSYTGNELAMGFDSLRKNYTHRHEWKHFRVNKSKVGKACSTLSALGFSCE